MSEDAKAGAVLVMLLSFLLIGLTHVITSMRSDRLWKDEIAKRGKAEYYLDENNNKQWRWK